MRKTPDSISKELAGLLMNFDSESKSGDLRKKVLALVPFLHRFRDLGKSLIPREMASAARDRIRYYFRKYPVTIINGDELLVISGIQDWPRRVRELRVQFGWAILNGVTAKQMEAEEGFLREKPGVSAMKPDDYILVDVNQDRDAAHRWNLANSIRRKKLAAKAKILDYFQANVGKPITGEELRYVANNKTEWARRVRELRTEQGWPIAARNTGRPDLAVGYYTLQAAQQSPEHDRRIPDPVRGEVLRRDRYMCANCGWSHSDYNPSDPRHLELHHVKFHHKGGDNIKENLITLCTICHDDLHKSAGRTRGS